MLVSHRAHLACRPLSPHASRRVDAANATAEKREQEARRDAASAARARDRAESDLRATQRDLSRAKDDLRDLARAKEDAAAARAELASARAEMGAMRATLEAQLTEAREVARGLHARLLAQQAPQAMPQQAQGGSWALSAAPPAQQQPAYAPQQAAYAPQQPAAYGGGQSFIAAAAAQQAAAAQGMGGGGSLFSHSPGAAVGAHGGLSYQQEPYFEAGAKRPYDAMAHGQPPPQQQQGWGAPPMQPQQQPQQQQQPSWADWQTADKRMRGGY